jgi:hypothetical protein
LVGRKKGRKDERVVFVLRKEGRKGRKKPTTPSFSI